MVKLLALYKKPLDVDSFMEHYNNTHLPLIKTIPGLIDVVVNQVKADAYGGEPSYFMITELHFASKESFKQAMESEENKNAGQDILRFAKGLVTLLVTETI